MKSTAWEGEVCSPPPLEGEVVDSPSALEGDQDQSAPWRSMGAHLEEKGEDRPTTEDHKHASKEYEGDTANTKVWTGCVPCYDHQKR